jgi:hypothetical protein
VQDAGMTTRARLATANDIAADLLSMKGAPAVIGGWLAVEYDDTIKGQSVDHVVIDDPTGS